jgi:hypothetical protein
VSGAGAGAGAGAVVVAVESVVFVSPSLLPQEVTNRPKAKARMLSFTIFIIKFLMVVSIYTKNPKR